MVVSPKPQNFEGELVETLLDREAGGWDINAVKKVFLPHEAEAILSILRQRVKPRIVGWSPPREGWFKVNVDGAVFKELGSCGIGVVIRNERGLLMGAMSRKLELPLGALEVEAKAFEVGIQLARDLGLRKVIVEGDAKTVTDALAGRCAPPSSIQMIIEGSWRWSHIVQEWQISHVGRTGNCAAHLMARNAKLVNDSIVWAPILECQLFKDVAGLDLMSS